MDGKRLDALPRAPDRGIWRGFGGGDFLTGEGRFFLGRLALGERRCAPRQAPRSGFGATRDGAFWRGVWAGFWVGRGAAERRLAGWFWGCGMPRGTGDGTGGWRGLRGVFVPFSGHAIGAFGGGFKQKV